MTGKPKAEEPQWRSECPIANTLDIVGDKWTLLVVRDLLEGKTRFSEFERSPEKIPTNILSDRLKRLESQGLVTRQRGEGRRFDYFVTDRGEALRPVILAMVSWGNDHVPNTWQPPKKYLTSPARSAKE